jgi:hypothetical protein
VRRRVRVWPLLSTGFVVIVTTAFTYGQQRFRIAGEPSILVLAAVTLVFIAGRLRRRPNQKTAARTVPEVSSPSP